MKHDDGHSWTTRWALAGVGALVALGGCYAGRGAQDHESGGSDDAGESGGDDDDDDDGDDDDDDDDGQIPDDLDPSAVLEPLTVRLNDTQYRFTVLDVLGITLDEQEEDWLPRDVPIDGHYSTSAHGQAFSPQYVLAYAYIARSVAERLDNDALLSDYGGCGDTSTACIEAFAAGLGRRMFRRPLSDDEVQTYVDLADAIAQAPETTDDDVVAGLVQHMMQSPRFVYRLEHETDGTPGDLRRLDGYEVASRLSYFLWQSAPDAELLEFAAEDWDPDALQAQVQRMVADPKFSRSRGVFWGDYSLASVSSFGTTDEALVQEHRTSLLATFDHLSGVDGAPQPLSALLDGTDVVLTPAIAEIAGGTPKGDGLEVYGVDELDERIGVVTHPSFLAAIGTTSFVGRGLFLSERLLCTHIAPPPDDVAEDIMQTAQQTAGMTPREASEFRFGLEPVCLGCHTQFEPIAYAFERYEVGGGYSLTDDQGRDLFSDGLLPGNGDRPAIEFADAAELLGALAVDEGVQACLVANMMEYGTGHPTSTNNELVQGAHAQFIDEGETFDALVHSIASSDQMSLIRIVAP